MKWPVESSNSITFPPPSSASITLPFFEPEEATGTSTDEVVWRGETITHRGEKVKW